MRVLLAVLRSSNPKQMYREYPLGVGFLGTILRQAGHEVRIYDENVEGRSSAFLDVVRDFRPAVAGFSVITPNYPATRRQIRSLKRLFPDIQIMAGGIHASLFPEDLINDGASAVVIGEGEPIINELVCRLGERHSLENMSSVVFRGDSGEAVSTGLRSQPVPLEALPRVDRSLYNLPLYSHHSMLASRGCPYRCSFCCNYTGTIRKGVSVQSCESVLAELEHVRDQYGAGEVFFADDLFLLRKQQILDFCHGCSARRLGVRWIAQLRADGLDIETAVAMSQAGCQRVYFGVESGSDAMLSRSRKGMNKAEIRRGISAALEAGLRVKTGWIYGLPGALAEQYESIDFMLELRPHEISIHQLIPFPGSIYYDLAERFGIRIADRKNFESFCYGGLEGGVRFDYLSHGQLVRLLEDTARALESAGYVSSDQATPESEYIYTTPLSQNPLTVFRAPASDVSGESCAISETRSTLSACVSLLL